MNETLYACCASIVCDKMHTKLTEDCYGCEHDRPSQRDHPCLTTDGTELKAAYYDSAMDTLDFSDVADLWRATMQGARITPAFLRDVWIKDNVAKHTERIDNMVDSRLRSVY